VEGAEDGVPGLCCPDRQLDCFEIPHLPHQNHVWIFTARGPQSICKRAGVLVEFALVDQAFVAGAHKLDRIFHRLDVDSRVVPLREKGIERGRLAGPCRSCHEDDAEGLRTHPSNVESGLAGR